MRESQYIVIPKNELYHHGILGMRWGIRRFQPYPKGYKGSGKEVGEAKRSKSGGLFFSKRQKKLEKQQNIKREQQKKNQAEKEKHDRDKESVLRKGSATEVLQYKGELTNQELQDATTRLRLEQQLTNLSKQELSSAFSKMDQAMNKVQTVTNWTKIGTDAWNSFASIYNATEGGRKTPLKTIKKTG